MLWLLGTLIYGVGLIAVLAALCAAPRCFRRDRMRDVFLAVFWPLVVLLAIAIHLGLMHDTSGEWHRN